MPASPITFAGGTVAPVVLHRTSPDTGTSPGGSGNLSDGVGSPSKVKPVLAYGVLAIVVVSLAAWLARDFMWMAAALGIHRGLGTVTVSSRLILAGLGGAAIALPLRPLQDRERWEKTVAVLGVCAWLLCGAFLALG